jgi:hypothetical protein
MKPKLPGQLSCGAADYPATDRTDGDGRSAAHGPWPPLPRSKLCGLQVRRRRGGGCPLRPVFFLGFGPPKSKNPQRKRLGVFAAMGNHWRVTCWSLTHAHILVLLMPKRSGCLTISSVRLQVECPQQPSINVCATCFTGIS